MDTVSRRRRESQVGPPRGGPPMTITDASTTPVVGARPQRSSGLLRTGGASALVAAVANALVAAGARVADVPLEIEGEQIPAVGFAMMTLMFSAAGLLV